MVSDFIVYTGVPTATVVAVVLASVTVLLTVGVVASVVLIRFVISKRKCEFIYHIECMHGLLHPCTLSLCNCIPTSVAAG